MLLELHIGHSKGNMGLVLTWVKHRILRPHTHNSLILNYNSLIWSQIYFLYIFVSFKFINTVIFTIHKYCEIFFNTSSSGKPNHHKDQRVLTSLNLLASPHLYWNCFNFGPYLFSHGQVFGFGLTHFYLDLSNFTRVIIISHRFSSVIFWNKSSNKFSS